MCPEHLLLPNVPPQVSVKIVGAGFFFLVFKATFDLQRILQQFLSTVVAPNLRRMRFGRRNRRRGFGYFVTCQLVVYWLRSRFGWGESHRRHVSIFFSYTRIIASSGSYVRLIEQWLIFRRRIFKTVTPNFSVQNLTRSQRYTEHCKPVVYYSYLLYRMRNSQDILYSDPRIRGS